MRNVVWIQSRESGKDSIFFEGEKKLSGSDKESFKISRFLSEAEFKPIYKSRSGSINEISKNSVGYFVSGLLLDKEESGRRIPFSGYAEGNIREVCEYFSLVLGSGSQGIDEADQKFIIKTVRSRNNKKKAVITGIAVLSLITIYYFYGEAQSYNGC